MKKLMFAAFAALCATVVQAAGEITSANVVGYNTTQVETTDTYQFIGGCFENMGTATFIPLSALTCTEGIEDGDQVQMANVDDEGIINFTVYEYWDGDGWVDPTSGEVVGDNVGLELGKGAWFISPSAKHVTTAGAVKNSAAIHTFTETSSIVSSAFPVPFCPNSADVSWGCSDGDQIQTSWVDGDGIINFTVYEYWDGDGWVDPTSGEALAAGTAVVTAGKGFWFITGSPESASFTEVSPIAAE